MDSGRKSNHDFCAGEYPYSQTDGSSSEQLTAGNCVREYSPDISPDGAHAVYVTDQYWGGEKREYYRYYEIEASGLDGSDRRPLTDDVDINTAPSWSPDGTRIAFVKEAVSEQGEGIYVMGADGSGARRVAAFGDESFFFHAAGPVWSPNGNLLAYVVRAPGEIQRDTLYTVRSDGSALTSVAAVDKEYLIDVPLSPPAWSPDGQHLAFAMDDGDAGEREGVYTVRPDGSELKKVLDGGAFQVSWSPEGSEILVMTSEGGYIIRADGSGLRRVVPPSISGFAAWSPDGSRIAVYSPSELLVTVSLDETDVRFLAALDDMGDFIALNAVPQDTTSNLRQDTAPSVLRRSSRGALSDAPCSAGVVVPTPEANPDLVQDCETLLGLRNMLAVNAEPDWKTHLPITGWEGVTVDGSPLRVQGLAIRTDHFPGTLPPELGLLTALRRLALVGHRSTYPLKIIKLTGAIPPELGDLRELEELTITRHFLTGSIPPELGRLGRLQRLDLSNNYLSGSIPLELGGLQSLVFLDLSRNLLTGSISELSVLNLVPNLTGNNLSGCAPVWLSKRWAEENGLEYCALAPAVSP